MSAERQLKTGDLTHQFDDTPILYGELIGPGYVRVFCPECREFHFHGWPEGVPLNSLEHRSAHCTGEHKKKGMFARGGYYISLQWEGKQ